MSEEKVCPLCGRSSECGVAAGKGIEECWCSRVCFPPDLLARVPAEMRDRACICAACAQMHLETEE